MGFHRSPWHVMGSLGIPRRHPAVSYVVQRPATCREMPRVVMVSHGLKMYPVTIPLGFPTMVGCLGIFHGNSHGASHESSHGIASGVPW